MSTGAVNTVIQRAIGDAAFRRQLQRDPQSALTGFDLSAAERAAIASGDPSRLTALGVDQRMSKAFGLGGFSDLGKTVVGDNTTGSGALIDENSSGASRALMGDDTTGSAALVGDNTSGSSALISPEGNVLDSGAVSDDTTGAAHAIVGDPAAGMDSAFATPDGSYLDAGSVGDPTSGTAALDPGDTSGIASTLDSAGLDTGGDIHPTEY